MVEFDCERCGIHVVIVTGPTHSENVFCLQCRFVESMDDEDKEVVEKFLNDHAPPASRDLTDDIVDEEPPF